MVSQQSASSVCSSKSAIGIRNLEGGNSLAQKQLRRPRDTPKPMRGKGNAVSTPSELPKSATEADRQAIRLGFLIHDVSRMRRTAYDQLMKPLGVTRAQWWVLAHLSRNDGMMQTQLAGTLDVGKASLGTLIERLESGGLIERREDPIDKRAKRVYISRAGQLLLKKMMTEESRLNAMILHGVSEAEREEMISHLSHIKVALLQHIAQNTGTESV
jgi:DNA-binding MarR family transcriptional regulator